MASSNMETVSILLPPGTMLCRILNLSLILCLLSLAATLCGSVESLTSFLLFFTPFFCFSLLLEDDPAEEVSGLQAGMQYSMGSSYEKSTIIIKENVLNIEPGMFLISCHIFI